MRYFKVLLENNNVVRDESNKVKAVGMVYPSCWNPNLIQVMAYKDNDESVPDYCLIKVEDTKLCVELIKSSKVIEMQEAEFEALVLEIRPKIDIHITYSDTAEEKLSTIKEDLQNFLDNKNMVSRIYETR